MSSAPDNPWIADDGDMLPDFIVGGAMKSGTTTLHEILASHPDVYMPEGELHFFDIDNILEHGDFLRFSGGQWISQDMAIDRERFWRWYAERFRQAGPHQRKGEDSTTYLASSRAARRVAAQPKPIRLIFMLRNPVDRAWSQYWHMVRSGRTWLTFEDVIRREPDTVLRRGLYVEQLRSFYSRIPAERILVISLESLLASPDATLDRVCGHIGVDPGGLGKRVADTHANEGVMPLFPRLQRLKNRLLREAGDMRYRDALPVPLTTTAALRGPVTWLLDRAHRILNPLVPSSPPPMRESTRALLVRFFREEMSELDELTGHSITKDWDL